ncbi:MAG: Methyltransferase domain [Gaiellaceae bacterium]|nr:Methyltransferase domain [Gaiellaceae bacterium]
MRLPPALAASATTAILELLPAPPARVLEVGFAGIHAEPLRLAGYEVVVVELDPAHLERARQRAGEVLTRVPRDAFDAVVAPEGLDVPPAPRVLLVRQDGSVACS